MTTWSDHGRRRNHGAAEFKTHCLEILDRLSAVAVLVRRTIHGFMRGSVVIPPGTDLTAPAVHGDPVDQMIVATARHLGIRWSPVTAISAYARRGHVTAIRC